MTVQAMQLNDRVSLRLFLTSITAKTVAVVQSARDESSRDMNKPRFLGVRRKSHGRGKADRFNPPGTRLDLSLTKIVIDSLSTIASPQTPSVINNPAWGQGPNCFTFK